MYANCVKKLCQNQKFGLMCDATTDRGMDKQLVILARLVDEGAKVATRFIDMPTCNLSSAQDLFNALNESLQ